jgi:hypothetical protein
MPLTVRFVDGQQPLRRVSPCPILGGKSHLLDRSKPFKMPPLRLQESRGFVSTVPPRRPSSHAGISTVTEHRAIRTHCRFRQGGVTCPHPHGNPLLPCSKAPCVLAGAFSFFECRKLAKIRITNWLKTAAAYPRKDGPCPVSADRDADRLPQIRASLGFKALHRSERGQ